MQRDGALSRSRHRSEGSIGEITFPSCVTGRTISRTIGNPVVCVTIRLVLIVLFYTAYFRYRSCLMRSSFYYSSHHSSFYELFNI